VLLSRDEIAKKRRDQGSYVFASQQLQNPVADESQGFKRDDVRYYDGVIALDKVTRYILVDPANAKRKKSDWTGAFVIGAAADGNIYVLDMVRDRLSLTQRAELLFRWHRAYKPEAIAYEQYGKDSDIEHFTDRMAREVYRFDLTAVGGTLSKEDRIRRLVPYFEGHRMWFPRQLHYTQYDGRTVDLVRSFIEEEYLGFPVSLHDDMLDALSRLFDIEIKQPGAALRLPKSGGRNRTGWQGA
jgi:predicted phage terminase large subunit-like protein